MAKNHAKEAEAASLRGENTRPTWKTLSAGVSCCEGGEEPSAEADVAAAAAGVQEQAGEDGSAGQHENERQTSSRADQEHTTAHNSDTTYQ